MKVMILFLVLSSVFMTGELSTTLVIAAHAQTRPETTMTRTELVEAAAVLKALMADWALIDYAPEHDFLVLVSESRDELNFYPKKSLVQMMERSGLIENLDKKGSSVREHHVHYERGPSVWKEVTEPGLIVFNYQVTQEGQTLLRDAPKLIGGPVRALRTATSPIDIQSKPLKVVTYDRPTIQKLVAAFDRKATALIEETFAPKNDQDRATAASRSFVCGPKLWTTLEPDARRHGLKPSGSLIGVTFDLAGKDAGQQEKASKLQDQLILPADEARLFWQTFREAFKIEAPLQIRRAAPAEHSAYTFYEEIEDDDFPPPDLAGRTVLFIVEKNKSKFMVLVQNAPQEDMEHFEPRVSWVEIMSTK